MMHKYHTPDNPGFTDKSMNPPLTDEQWANAYRDLVSENKRLQEECQSLRLALNKANEWRQDQDVGC